MKLALFEIIFLLLSFFVAFSILGMQGVLLSVLGATALIVVIILITLAIKKVLFRNKKISFLLEYLILVIILFLLLFIQFEVGGIQSIISTLLGSLLSFAVVMFFIAVLELLKLDLVLTKHKSKYIRALNKILFEEKELSVLFFIIFLLSFTVFLTYIFWGIADWYYLLISILFFVMGLVLFVALDSQFYKHKKQTLLNNFQVLLNRHKFTFNVITAILLLLFLILTVLSLVNEFYFSVSSRPVFPVQIGEVELLPFPNGAKTIAIFTNDDAGAPFTEPSEFKQIIDIHVKNNISGTFFVVAGGIENNEKWVNAVKYALKRNQNIGLHSYDHNLFEYGLAFYFINYPGYEKQKEIFDMSSKVLREKLNFEPKGFRPTIWADNKYTLNILNEQGFNFLSDKVLIFTPRFPYYRMIDGKVSDILVVPASIEFGFIFGPAWFKQAIVEFNKYIVYLLIEKHKDSNIPFVFVTHTGRFDNGYAFLYLDEIMEMVNQDKEITVMNMHDYVEWVKAYEKVEVSKKNERIFIKNGFPGLVVSYKGQIYNANEDLEINENTL